MWRSLFLSFGITAILVGSQLFFVEQIEIKKLRRGKGQNVAQTTTTGTPFQNASWQTPTIASQPATVLYRPKEWMPWSLLAVGAVTLIYTFTIPRRSRSSE